VLIRGLSSRLLGKARAAPDGGDQRRAEHRAATLGFAHIGLARRPHAIAQHGPGSSVDQAQQQALRYAFGGSDAAAPVIEEEEKSGHASRQSVSIASA
jgi:hypothetical protein